MTLTESQASSGKKHSNDGLDGSGKKVGEEVEVMDVGT